MKCSNCNTDNPAQNKFCLNCGTPLSAPTTAPSAKPGTVYFWGRAVPAVIGIPLLFCVVFACAVILVSSPKSATRPTAISELSDSAPATPTIRLTVPAAASKPPQATSTTAAPTSTPKPQTPLDQLRSIATTDEAAGTYHLALRNASLANSLATLEYDPNTELFNETSAIYGAALNFRYVVPKTFDSIQTANTIETRLWAPFKDVYGKTVNEIAVRLRVTRATAAKIDWKSYRSQNLDKILTGTGDQFYIHPALGKAWADFQKQ